MDLADFGCCKDNLTASGGSSSVLSNALNAFLTSMHFVDDVDRMHRHWTIADTFDDLARIIHTGVARVPYVNMSPHYGCAGSQLPQGSSVSAPLPSMPMQFNPLASRRAVEVLPIPRTPVKQRHARDVSSLAHCLKCGQALPGQSGRQTFLVGICVQARDSTGASGHF